MIYLLFGEDQFSLRQEVEKIKTSSLPAEAMDFNFTRLDASRNGFNLDEVINIADAFPFLSDHRLVVVNDLLQRLGKGADGETGSTRTSKAASKSKASGATASPRERFIKFLETAPASTILVLCETKVAKNDVVYKTVQKNGQTKEFVPPKGVHLEKWIIDRARFLNIKIEPQAAGLLAQYTGSDLWRLENELQKLASFAGEGVVVTVGMVEKISAEVRDTPIFRLTEALSRKDLKDALVQLNRLKNETTLGRAGFARYVFNGITRLVYDLVRVRELAAKRLSSAEIASTLSMHPFVAEKTMGLSRNFQASRLDWLYHRLTELDYADKSGKADLTTELDLLLFDICARN